MARKFYSLVLLFVAILKPSKKKHFFSPRFPIPSKKLVNLVNCYLVKNKTFFKTTFFLLGLTTDPGKSHQRML